MTSSNLQATIAEFAASLRYEHLGPEVLHDVSYRVLDWIGCALAGSSYQPAVIAAGMVREAGGAPQASVVHAGLKVPMAQAALVNGIMGHAAEYDDGHRLAISHPGSVTVPVALAVAEHLGSSGKELLTAIVAGYEIIIRLAAAVNPSHYRFWHATSTNGVFAAAATAASLLKLDPAATSMALGIAGTMASGLQETFGSHAKPLNIGHACQSGVQAVLLAKAGFTGPEDIIGGAKGFIAATTEKCDRELIAQIKDRQLMAATAFYKMYASCGHTHAPLEALFNLLRKTDLAADSIRAIRVASYRTAVQLTGAFKNRTEDEAKFSLPFCAASAILHRRVTLAEFAPDKLADPKLVELAQKVSLTEDEEATSVFPRKRRARVTIEFNDGRSVEEYLLHPTDTPDYPALERKFLSLAEMAMPARDARWVADTVLNLEQCSDLGPLMARLRSEGSLANAAR